MKILSNFDTKFLDKVLTKKKNVFSDDQILLIRRSKYHLFFVVIFHLILYLLLLAIMYSFFLYIKVPNFIIVWWILVWFIVVWFRVVHKFLKYKYDFTIVTPKWVMTYKQKWILNSVSKEIPARRIISIEVCRTNFLWNMFGYGHVDIVSDLSEHAHLWEDNEVASVIGMTYVDDAYEVKEKISDLCFD